MSRNLADEAKGSLIKMIGRYIIIIPADIKTSSSIVSMSGEETWNTFSEDEQKEEIKERVKFLLRENYKNEYNEYAPEDGSSLSDKKDRIIFPKDRIGQLPASHIVPEILAVDMTTLLNPQKHPKLVNFCCEIPEILKKLESAGNDIDSRTTICGEQFVEQLSLIFAPSLPWADCSIGKEFNHCTLEGPLFQMVNKFFGKFFKHNTDEVST